MTDAPAIKEGSSDQVEVRVLFFAAAKDLAGCAGTTIRISPSSTPHFALNSFVLPKFPSLAALAPYCALAVNLEYVDASEGAVAPPFRDGDELAIIPPISGG